MHSFRALVIGTVTLAGLIPVSSHADFRYAPDDASTSSAPSRMGAVPLPPRPAAPPHSYGAQGLAPGQGDVISGFGKQVPMVLALREIVPSSYQFAYAPGINLGTLVSWQGGKPWHDVLNDLLATQRLYASESDQVISIARQ